MKKASNCTKEAGGVIEAFQREVKELAFDVALEHANNKPRANQEFYQQPGQILMKQCDARSKEKCKQLQSLNDERQAKDVGVATPIRLKQVLDKNINTLVREIDGKEYEENATKELVKEKWEWINIEA